MFNIFFRMETTGDTELQENGKRPKEEEVNWIFWNLDQDK